MLQDLLYTKPSNRLHLCVLSDHTDSITSNTSSKWWNVFSEPFVTNTSYWE